MSGAWVPQVGRTCQARWEDQGEISWHLAEVSEIKNGEYAVQWLGLGYDCYTEGLQRHEIRAPRKSATAAKSAAVQKQEKTKAGSAAKMRAKQRLSELVQASKKEMETTQQQLAEDKEKFVANLNERRQQLKEALKKLDSDEQRYMKTLHDKLQKAKAKYQATAEASG
eukprot:TRINITY_DN23165_c0_g1_i1.p1 TRINITY_DN23165_c0_g1~~TRINITY_DN23165_c0_g1_i1.p1  ORF type:complete len:195 (+),score=77.65 TRINITY_DN23165_c0_g1_i1:84-587(+)